MTLVSVEDTAARRQNLREDVQWNIARRNEVFKLVREIGDEQLRYDLTWLRSLRDKANHSSRDAYERNQRYYCKEQRRIAEHLKGKLPLLRKVDKAIRELSPKPNHLTGMHDAGGYFKFENIALMRAVFAAEMGLHVSQSYHWRGWHRHHHHWR